MKIQISLLCILLSSCTMSPTISYQSDIEPVFKNKCLRCHHAPDGLGYRSVGLSLSSYEKLMHGTIYGPVVIPGDSKRSILNKLIEGRAGNYAKMSHGKKDALNKAEIEIIKRWVNQNANNN